MLSYIYSRESNSHATHIKTHSCTERKPCNPTNFRSMEDDDWVKFGYVIWKGRSGLRQDQVLQLYQRAWRNIYNSQAPLDGPGPVNFLNNPQYVLSKPVPWLGALAPNLAAPPQPVASSSSGPQPAPVASSSSVPAQAVGEDLLSSGLPPFP